VAEAIAVAEPIASAGRPRGTPARWGLRAVVVLYLGILVLLPLGLVIWRTFEPGLSKFFDTLTDPDTIHAFKLSVIIAAIAVVLNTIFGIGVALLLARYRFPGRRLLSAFVDLSVSVSPIVVGLALILVYGPSGWFGAPLNALGWKVIFAVPSMVIATVFVSLPLVVRAVVPVLEEAGTDQEQAARSLGANAFARFRRITLPIIASAITYGVVLTIARCLGEFGAVLVVSGNVEGQTETAPLRIANLYENDQDTAAAYAVTFVLIAIAIMAIVAVTFLRRRATK
jgi:sulfate/thiosulfate transport system permease protein